MNGPIDDRDARQERPTFPVWAPATLIGLGAISLALAAEAGPRDASLAAGVFPPWWSQSGVLTAAAQAGDVIAVGALPFVVVIRSPQGPAGPRLRDAGAFLSLKAGLAGPCGAA